LKNSYYEGNKRYKKKPNDNSTEDIFVPKKLNVISSKEGNSLLDYYPKSY